MNDTAFAYQRLSSRTSLQRGSMRRYRELQAMIAKRDNLRIVREFFDVKSGRTMAREQFQSMLELIDDGDVKHVIIPKIDRFGRTARHMMETEYQLSVKGVQIHTDYGIVTTRNTAGKMVFYMQCIMAEFELDRTKERLDAGLRQYEQGGNKRGRGYKRKKENR